MALDRGSISNVVRVSAASTVAIATCSSSKKVYIKSIAVHADLDLESTLELGKFMLFQMVKQLQMLLMDHIST